jgi:hypothetical protein
MANDRAALVIEVPNDYSALQLQLLEKGTISKPFWLTIPDHISYFTAEGLKQVCQAAGWNQHLLMSDFPIDFFLTNPYTNYVEDRLRGPACHQSRVLIDNMMHQTSIPATVQYYTSLAELGMGRQLIGFYQPPK